MLALWSKALTLQQQGKLVISVFQERLSYSPAPITKAAQRDWRTKTHCLLECFLGLVIKWFMVLNKNALKVYYLPNHGLGAFRYYK